jgi:hypothetical protein
MESGISPSSTTARVLVGIMNDVFTCIKFTIELAGHFPDNKLPNLDTWVADRLTILFEYYGKPMANGLSWGSIKQGPQTFQPFKGNYKKTKKHRSWGWHWKQNGNFRSSMHQNEDQGSFIREAVSKGIRNSKEKVRRSTLKETDKQYLPLYQDANWRRNMNSKTKAMKRKTWFLEKEEEA